MSLSSILVPFANFLIYNCQFLLLFFILPLTQELKQGGHHIADESVHPVFRLVDGFIPIDGCNRAKKEIVSIVSLDGMQSQMEAVNIDVVRGAIFGLKPVID